MAKTQAQMEREIVDGLKDATGNAVRGWFDVLKKCGIEKRNDMIKWLKTDHNLKHSQASAIVGQYLNGGKPVYADDGQLLEDQFAGKQHLRPLYDALVRAILKGNKNVNVQPTKTYVSFRGRREFAVAAIKKDEIRVGLDLGDRAPTGRVEMARSLGAMPRISHMIVVRDTSEIDAELLGLLQFAWNRVESPVTSTGA